MATYTVIGMSVRLDADVTRFVAYLNEHGWLFKEGCAVLVDLLGVGADDGQILLDMGRH